MLYIDLHKAAYKLHYKMEFQGLPVSIENRKGSKRHWYDPHNKTEGTTTMEFPYGYIRGTLGTDGDHVDVYVGDDKDADKVFVITQMKAPEFKVVDEQKCMLGFSTGKEAKAAYIRHYNNPKFFGKMKALTMDEFKSKLKKKGSLIKHVNAGIIPGGDAMEKSLFKVINDQVFVKALNSGDEDPSKKVFKNLLDEIDERREKAIDLEQFEEENEKIEKKVPVVEAKLPEKVEKAEEVEKALTAAAIAPIVKRHRMMSDNYKAGIAQPQPEVGTNKTWDMMSPPVVPIRRVVTPQPEVRKAEAFDPCKSCGHMTKADTACIHCESRNNVTESVPYWRR